MAVGWRFQGGAGAAVVALISYPPPTTVPPYDLYIPLGAGSAALQFDKLSLAEGLAVRNFSFHSSIASLQYNRVG
ncbi:hypothetical protein QLX08_005439 [Tetragonisca angustula]|uniref:Uncharacterized protein n=1 Tax=Tetragonisca angustula TaxID=166442 RepID=A0AAW0ZY80_9HYME